MTREGSQIISEMRDHSRVRRIGHGRARVLDVPDFHNAWRVFPLGFPQEISMIGEYQLKVEAQTLKTDNHESRLLSKSKYDLYLRSVNTWTTLVFKEHFNTIKAI